ncbi:DNA replication complex GINS protein SLD5-like [Centruroides sculpturatus]|uniref:DNA replication complex GINS protein SLD5-like n=1 Tax=Centruroides sculpturatus TaxID=218467 RepID=UPI000C6E4377|nr:DNA replication complex GINS protein SLD5-like [Centruroides sculpturatus]XP_023210504.1 DNA replication complex GINS protein SLD5-like [Centruroides sculpturatus]XP_023210505.1 DNA replication complex GINS protein SLD5-like [Centruroides sculpturatus]
MDGDSYDFMEEGENQEELTTPGAVLQKLEEVWLNESLAPELLPYESELVDCMLDQVQHMEENLLKSSKKADFRIMIHKMELTRISYIINNYLRIRLKKIEKYGAHYLEEVKKRPDLMSLNEQRFAKSYITSIKSYLHNVILQHLPLNMQNLDMAAVGQKPNVDSYVFLEAKQNCNGVLLEEDTIEGR